VEIWPFCLLMVAVLGSLYGGVATPTEAAGVGAAAALLIAIGYRSLTWKALKAACLGTVRTSAMLFFIIISAKAMAIALAYYGVPVMMKGFAAGLGSPYLLLLIISVVYLLLGTVFEDFSLMIIMLPFVLPMIRASGFDQVWFGVFMTVLLQAGLLSPPVGLNLFVIQGVTGAALSEVIWGSLPFLLVMLGVAIGLVMFPPLALWLPAHWIG
jgi:tripartite ATP-independent transporter DctM subunit